MDGYLVVIACGKQKIWDRYPKAGPTAARFAYTSPIFHASVRYAERFAGKWLVLSAKYGFIEPDFIIPENYDLTFYQETAIPGDKLRAQASEYSSGQYRTIGVLGPEVYFSRAAHAFAGSCVVVRHINGNVRYPPKFLALINSLIQDGVWVKESPGGR